MPERTSIVTNEKVTYDGLFSLKDVYKLINDWTADKGYVPVETKASESVTKKGKHVELVLEPFKSLTDYAKSAVKIHISALDLTEVEVKKDNKKKKLNKGKLTVTFNAWLETDIEARWEAQPIFYFIRTVFEKYIYTPYLSGFTSEIKEDVNMLKDNLKAHLNLYKY